MADYNETSVSGTSWQRAYLIIFENNLGSQLNARYDEEKIFNTGDTIIRTKGIPPITYTPDLNDNIELRDPVTLELMGQSVPVALVHHAIFSDYINRAKSRDRGPSPFASWVVNDGLNIWEAPIPKPDEITDWEWYEPSIKWIPIRPGEDYYWDDSLEQWVQLNI
jgi:hypothetical protein